MTERYMFKMIVLTVRYEILNTELDEVALWFNSNKLTLNVNKTQMIMLSRKKI